LKKEAMDVQQGRRRIRHCLTPPTDFNFGVLHPVARTLSRLLEEPSLATTVQGVYLHLYFDCYNRSGLREMIS
jgi:hypothetical protein